MKHQLGLFSTISIAIGAMIGGGIFAMAGLSLHVNRGEAPLAFMIAGVIALLTSYSYFKLSQRYAHHGGSLYYLCKAYGENTFVKACGLLLMLTYVVRMGIYAHGFSAYASMFFPFDDHEHRFLMGQILVCVFLGGVAIMNLSSESMSTSTGNLLNLIKMLLLAAFIGAGFLIPMEFNLVTRLEHWSTSSQMLLFGGMIIFINFAGFELIAHHSDRIRNPKRNLPIAFIASIVITMVFYVLILLVVMGHLSFDAINANSHHVLATAAGRLAGQTGTVIISIAAILATATAMNATIASTGSMSYHLLAGILPTQEHSIDTKQRRQGIVFFAVASMVVIFLLPLHILAFLASALMLFIYLLINCANIKLSRHTVSNPWVSGLASLSCIAAMVSITWGIDAGPYKGVESAFLAAVFLAVFFFAVGKYRLRYRRSKA